LQKAIGRRETYLYIIAKEGDKKKKKPHWEQLGEERVRGQALQVFGKTESPLCCNVAGERFD